MRLAVTASTGQLGRLAVTALLEQGVPPEDIVAVARSPHKAADLTARGVTVRRGDYDDPATLRAAFEGVEKVLMVPSMAMPAPRVVQHQALLDAAIDAGVRHVLTITVVGTHPDNPFRITPYLLYAERSIRSSGMAWTILRNTLYADPLVDWVPDIVRMGTIPYPTGEGRMTWACRADLARAASAALSGEGHAGKIYELTGPQAYTNAELCTLIADVTGRPVEDRAATVEDYVRACLDGGMPEPAARFMATLYAPVPLGLNAAVTDDIERLTGSPPQGLRALIQARFPEGLSA